uniref:IQ motif containing B1 n=1 Tax=Periophthalmus magnuspinnatus TaxID=409849 RepID=A0A3B3ZB73_9GOBI
MNRLFKVMFSSVSSSCCAGVEPGDQSKAFDRLFLPSVINALGLSDDTVILLLNDIVSQLAVSSEAQVGGASVRLLLLFAHQLRTRLPPLFRAFRGLDSLLSKDWRGRGYDQEVDQLIKIIQSSESSDDIERVRAACVIQAAWRSHKTRRRVKNLNRAVSTLQRKYSLCVFQVNLRRQQARRKFHLKQRQLLQLLPPGTPHMNLQWIISDRFTTDQGLKHRLYISMDIANLLAFLDHRRAAKVPPSSFWTGQKGLTDRQRAELKTQVDNYITLHPSSCVSLEECLCLHEEVQSLWVSESEAVVQRRRQEQRIQVLLAHTKTQLTMLREAPGLSSVSLLEAESYLSPSPSIVAQARDSHNSLLQSDRSPWWRTLSEVPSGHAPLEELEAELRGGL